MNTFIMTGRVGRDAETRYIQSGTAVTSVPVACDSGFGDKKKTLWVRATIWGKQGEALAGYLLKGTEVSMSGELSENEFTKESGEKTKSLELRVDRVKLVGGKKQGQSAPQQQNQNQNQNYQQQAPQQQAQQNQQRPTQQNTQGGYGGQQSMPDNEFDGDIPF